MRIYDKRIAFMISDQHLIPHGGIGQFAKSFTEMCDNLNWKVDLILDKQPRSDFADLIKSLGANIIIPENVVSYAKHNSLFAFSDSVNFERIINFRNSLVQAFSRNCYDLIVCNTQEAMSAAYVFDYGDYIPVMFYTHLHSMIFRDTQNFDDVFLSSYHTFYNKHMEFDKVIIGTQTTKNVKELEKYGAVNCVLLTMPLSERDLLIDSDKQKKDGVLFIGRWEKNKGFEAFIKVIKESGLPAKVLTNESGKKKFEKRFKEEGIADYTIKAGVVGKEKVDFIKSARVHFNPSLRENYPFAFFECLGHMPCVVLDKQDWSDNFDSEYYTKTSLKKAAQTVKEIYQNKSKKGNIEYVRKLDSNTTAAWVKFLTSWEGKRSNSTKAKINEYEKFRYDQFLQDLERDAIAQEDIVSVLSNKHKFYIKYTNDYTYMSVNEDFTPEEETSSLFVF